MAKSNNLLKTVWVTVVLALASNLLLAQKIYRVDPPNWWVGMENPELQILIYGENLAQYQVSLDRPELYSGVLLTENLNYLFVNLSIPKNTKAGELKIDLSKNGKIVKSLSYSLKERVERPGGYGGFKASDVMYLIMPDRFANGDPSNDNVEGMKEGCDRALPDGRHGGDIQGIIDHLDYVKELGATALWINPLTENDMPSYSYHGYATTDHYKIDPRFGTNEDYLQLVREAQKKGLKMVQDIVLNHCGLEVWWKDDVPAKDWVYQFPEFTRTTYNVASITDPHASPEDVKMMVDGWFDKSMPDLNQRNPLVANYLIQNSIWWIEYAGLDGIRLDTQPYSDRFMVAEWGRRIREEYPNFNIVGEAWVQNPIWVAYWQERKDNKDGFNSMVPVVKDFALMFAIREALIEKAAWNKGMVKIYNVLSQDYAYADPYKLLTFGDNHDLSRMLTHFEGDVDRLKMAVAILATTRGIPSFYIGTEILMEGDEKQGHGKMRKDFPGGWPGDQNNAFTKEGRTEAQDEMFNYVVTLLNWRKDKDVIHNGHLTHYLPKENVYVYFRHNQHERVMVVINNNTARTLDTQRFASMLEGKTSGYDVIRKISIPDLSKIKLDAHSAYIIELK